MMHTSFSDNETLGRFTPQPPVQSEELRACYQRIAELEADLREIREFLEDQVYCEPEPNRAMALVSLIDESLHGRILK